MIVDGRDVDMKESNFDQSVQSRGQNVCRSVIIVSEILPILNSRSQKKKAERFVYETPAQGIRRIRNDFYDRTVNDQPDDDRARIARPNLYRWGT